MKKICAILVAVCGAGSTFAQIQPQTVEYSNAATAQEASKVSTSSATQSKESALELEKKALSGDINATFELGVYYARGLNGVKQDAQKAITLLTSAAEKNVVAAQSYLGYIYGEGKLVQRNYDLAVYWRELAATNGTTADRWTLGNAFLYGFFVPKNQIKALFWISQAADEGDGNAILKLIEIYKNLKDNSQLQIWQAKFAELEVKAAQKGNVAAMAAIAKKYMSGKEGLQKNRAEAIYWYKMAAEKENFEAMEKVAQMYAKGRYLPKNPQKAQEYFEKLAKQDIRYCFKISSFFAEGNDGFPQDLEQAAFWYERAAQNSDISTKNHLAWKYWAGSGVPQNSNRALEICQEIAKKIPPQSERPRSQMETLTITMLGDISAGKSAPLDYGKYVGASTRK